MKTDSILKKIKDFYLCKVKSEDDATEFKTTYVHNTIKENDKSSLILALTGATGNYTTALAQHYLLTNNEIKGVTKLEQGLFWIYYYISREQLDSIVFSADNLGFCIGLSWLFEKNELLENSILKLEEYWRVTNNEYYRKTNEINPYSISHNSFLYLLYKNKFTDISSYFVEKDSVYIRLLASIQCPNEQISSLLEEACDYHLVHIPLMRNKIDPIEFRWLELYPYEIIIYLKVRQTLGFEIPQINHKLMTTAVAKADLHLSEYKIEEDDLLNMILDKLSPVRGKFCP